MTCPGSAGSHRRRFLQSATATAGVGLVAASSSAKAYQQDNGARGDDAVPRATLGRTGAKVTKLGMGTSWALSPSFVQAALYAGVRYIDTSESYENTNSEKVLGQVLERTKMRDKVFIVTKNSKGKVAGDDAPKVYRERLDESLGRLKTDYIDAYYIHGVGGPKELAHLSDPGVKKAFEDLKKAGKIKYAGLSCHDALLVEFINAAVDCGWIDQIMLKYNFRDKVDAVALEKALDRAHKANIGLVAMKTQGGAEVSYPDRVADYVQKGFKKEVAAIKSVWADPRIQVVVSEMTTLSDLRENVAASKAPLTAMETKMLEQYRLQTANLYCHGCGTLCETASKGVKVSEVMRYLRYYEAYGKRQSARALYQALPAEARMMADLEVDKLDAACPHGLPVSDLLKKADRLMA
jgi:predicted aldo/keto reductase-like oxidoreductase